jgi:hypothetical protein
VKIIAVCLMLSTLIATAGSADIVEWQDADGVRHYTNIKEEVPQEYSAQVVVDERTHPPQGSSEAQVVAEPSPDAAATDDDAALAYLEGLERGLDVAARTVNTGGSVTVNGPLAVTIPMPIPYDVSPTGYDWLLTAYPFLSGYYPAVTTFRRHRPTEHHQRVATNFQGPFRLPSPFVSPMGPPPLGAVGPPPLGAAGPPPLGAVGPPPLGAAGPHGGRARRL